MPELTDLELLALKHPARAKGYSDRLIPVDPIEGEEWKNIITPEGESIYYVSNKGRVKKETILKSGKAISSLLKPQCINGRYTVGLTLRPKDTFKFYVHRLVLECFGVFRTSPNDIVMFKDGNTANCALDNLQWSNRNSVSIAMMENGSRTRKLKTKEVLNKQGKKIYRMVQYSEKDYEQMRFLYSSGVAQLKIAEIFKCTQAMISLVVNGKLVA